MIQLGGGIPCISIMGIFPGDRQVGMTEAFLNIERVCASLQGKGCVGVSKMVHDAITMLLEGAILCNLLQLFTSV